MSLFPWQIRTAVSSDVTLLHAIARASFAHPWNSEQFRGELAQGGVVALMAFSPTGAAGGYLCLSCTGDEAEIRSLAVVPHLRCRGLGTLLLNEGVHRAGLAGARKVFLEVANHNRSALQLYRKNGFRSVGLRRDYYGPSNDASILVIDLPREPVP